MVPVLSRSVTGAGVRSGAASQPASSNRHSSSLSNGMHSFFIILILL